MMASRESRRDRGASKRSKRRQGQRRDRGEGRNRRRGARRGRARRGRTGSRRERRNRGQHSRSRRRRRGSMRREKLREPIERENYIKMLTVPVAVPIDKKEYGETIVIWIIIWRNTCVNDI